MDLVCRTIPLNAQHRLSRPESKRGGTDGAYDAVIGEEVKIVLVFRPGAKITADEIHSFAGGRMAGFMVPWCIEVAASLPYTEAGEIKRKTLACFNPQTWDSRSRILHDGIEGF